MTGSPWWAGAFTGALAMFVVVVFWRFGHSILERWEILPGQKRLLSVPTWARIMIAVSDIAMGLCFGLGQLNFVTDFNSERVLLSLAAFAAAIVAAFVAWSMRWLADETKWAWRTDRLAALAPPGEHHEQGRQQHADNAR